MIARGDAIPRHFDTVTAIARDHAPADRAASICANAVKAVLGAGAILHEAAGGNLYPVEVVRPRPDQLGRAPLPAPGPAGDRSRPTGAAGPPLPRHRRRA